MNGIQEVGGSIPPGSTISPLRDPILTTAAPIGLDRMSGRFALGRPTSLDLAGLSFVLGPLRRIAGRDRRPDGLWEGKVGAAGCSAAMRATSP